MNEKQVNTKIGDVSSPEEKNSALPQGGPGPCHQPYTQYLPELRNDPDALFTAAVIDVTRGTRVIASILRGHLNDLYAIEGGAGDSVRMLLTAGDTEALAALAERSLDDLYAWAEQRIDHLNARAKTGAQA